VKISGYGYEDADDQADDGSIDIENSPAFKIGGGTQAVDSLVLLRPKGVDANGNPIYEFIPKGGSGGDCNPVTSVQCTGGMLIVTYGECPMTSQVYDCKTLSPLDPGTPYYHQCFGFGQLPNAFNFEAGPFTNVDATSISTKYRMSID